MLGQNILIINLMDKLHEESKGVSEREEERGWERECVVEECSELNSK